MSELLLDRMSEVSMRRNSREKVVKEATTILESAIFASLPFPGTIWKAITVCLRKIDWSINYGT